MGLGTLVGFLAIIVALYILWCIQEVLLLAFAAIVFATAINQLVKWLQKTFKLDRKIAVAISAIGVLALAAGFVALVIPPFVDQFQELITAVTLLAQVAFAVFFGLLGLFLALPITVVAQVWLKEVLVKDILDRWQINDNNKFNSRKLRRKEILIEKRQQQ